MANGAFTPMGFETPEEIRRRIGRTQAMEEQALTRSMPGNLNQMIAQTAFQGGRQLAKGLAGAFGVQEPEDPAIALAARRQEFLSDVDITDRNQLIEKSREALREGDVALGFMLADRGLSLVTPKQEKKPDIVQTALFATGGDEGAARELVKDWKARGDSTTPALIRYAKFLRPDDVGGQQALVEGWKTAKINVTPPTRAELKIGKNFFEKTDFSGEVSSDEEALYIDYLVTEAKKSLKEKGAAGTAAGLLKEMGQVHENSKGAFTANPGLPIIGTAGMNDFSLDVESLINVSAPPPPADTEAEDIGAMGTDDLFKLLGGQ